MLRTVAVQEGEDRRQLSRAVVAAVQDRMQEREVSAYRLHKLTGIAQTTISGWTRGLSAPGLDDLGRIAAALETTPAVLLEQAGARTP